MKTFLTSFLHSFTSTLLPLNFQCVINYKVDQTATTSSLDSSRRINFFYSQSRALISWINSWLWFPHKNRCNIFWFNLEWFCQIGLPCFLLKLNAVTFGSQFNKVVNFIDLKINPNDNCSQRLFNIQNQKFSISMPFKKV